MDFFIRLYGQESRKALEQNPEKIIFYDGECLLCESSVLWIQKRNHSESLFFALLSGETARKMAVLGTNAPNSVLYWKQGQLFSKSNAILEICLELSFPWKLAHGFVVVPSILRDCIYNVVARNRYRWFGKKQDCSIPSRLTKSRNLP